MRVSHPPRGLAGADNLGCGGSGDGGGRAGGRGHVDAGGRGSGIVLPLAVSGRRQALKSLMPGFDQELEELL